MPNAIDELLELPEPDLLDELLELPGLLESGRARHLREAAGLSAVALARQLDVSPATVTRWEAGTRRPIGANARRYARLLSRLAARESVTS